MMDGGDQHPTTPTKSTAPPATARTPKGTGATNGLDGDHETWDPIRELGLFEVGRARITCLGKTWDNKRCRRGPSVNNNRPCLLHESSVLQSYIQRLKGLSVTEVVMRRVDLLQDLAEAMMCLKEPDEDSQWEGHQSEQAAAQAYTWRRHLTRKANLIRVPRVIRPEAYAIDSSATKRRRDGDSPSPSNKRQACSGNNEDCIMLSQLSTDSQEPTADAGGSPSSTPSTPRYGGKRVRAMPLLPAERLAHGVRTLERRLQEKDAIIRDIELELRDARQAAAAAKCGSPAKENGIDQTQVQNSQ